MLAQQICGQVKRLERTVALGVGAQVGQALGVAAIADGDVQDAAGVHGVVVDREAALVAVHVACGTACARSGITGARRKSPRPQLGACRSSVCRMAAGHHGGRSHRCRRCPRRTGRPGARGRCASAPTPCRRSPRCTLQPGKPASACVMLREGSPPFGGKTRAEVVSSVLTRIVDVPAHAVTHCPSVDC